MNKLEKLKSILKKMDSVLLAYSGGLDSTFLLKVAGDVLGSKVLAVTAVSPTYPLEELNFSKNTAKALGAKHSVIKTREFRDKKFISNPVNRCYFCKKELFGRLRGIAKKNKLNFIVDGSNLSDSQDFRPGNIAKKEFNVRSPLKEAGLDKEDIRSLSKALGLETWNKPSLACLASRVPYDTKISLRILKRINKAEDFLKKIGFTTVRVRHYNSLCRIEVAKEDIPRLVKKRFLVAATLKKIGYDYVTIDLQGYRTGSMNEVVKR